MQICKSWLAGVIILAAGSLAALSLAWGQETAPPAAPNGQPPMFPIKAPAAPSAPFNLTKLPPAQRQFCLGAKAGKEWLLRRNRPDGRFLYGIVPSLRTPLYEDNYLHQAAAALALARCAVFFKEERAATVARQALLTLLLETKKDEKNPQVRYPIAPGVSSLAAASWLVLAINELPSPGADLLQQSEELCQYLRSRQQQDGSFESSSSSDPAYTREKDGQTAGLALYALMRSLHQRQEPWKLEAVRKARDFYQAQWRASKEMPMVPWFSAACVEACLLTKEQSFAQCANEMNDWLCTLQYKEMPSQRKHWIGGFQKWGQDKVQLEPPAVHSAVYMEGLAQGCRLARERGDLKRYQAYQQALELCGQFLLSLQYTEANSQHFEARYRQDFVLGGFHPTHQDGTLRLDYTQQGVCGLVKYLADVAQVK